MFSSRSRGAAPEDVPRLVVLMVLGLIEECEKRGQVIE